MVLGVNSWNEPKDMLEVFRSQHEVNYPLLQNGESVALNYGLGTGVPVTIWIKPDGKIMEVEMRYHGPEPLFENTKKLLHSSG